MRAPPHRARRCRTTRRASAALLATLVAMPAFAQDPARVDGGGGTDPAAASGGHARPAAPFAGQPASTSLQAQWRALTQPTPEDYRRAYGNADIVQRLKTPGPALGASYPASMSLAPAGVALDAGALRQASDEFARSLGPVLQQLRQDVDAELRRGTH